MPNYLKQSELLNQQIDNVLNIDPKAIVQQIEETEKLTTILDVVNHNFSSYQQCHCNKTGRPLHKLSINMFQDLLTIHSDARRAEFALQAYHLSQYALDWQFTDDIALDKLFKLDPIGYAIHALDIIYCPIWEKTKLNPWAIHNEKILAWNKCSQFISNSGLEKIIELNEHLRRFLSLVTPNRLNNLQSLTIFNLPDLFNSSFNISMFQDAIRETLVDIVKHNYNEKILVTTGCVANIKSKYGGLLAYSKQNKLSVLNAIESVMYDLRDFMGQKTPDQIEVHVGKSAKDISIKPTVHKAGNPLKLKVNPKTEKQVTRTNPYSLMFAAQREKK